MGGVLGLGLGKTSCSRMAAEEPPKSTAWAQGVSAVGYGAASIAIIAVNKAVLTTWGYV